MNELSKDKNGDLCYCDLFPEASSSQADARKRLNLRITKRTVQNVNEPSKTSTENQMKTKPCDNNIDDLVRYIDGDETTSMEGKSKKSKKKNKSTSKNSNVDPLPPPPPPPPPQPPVSKKKKKGKSKTEEPIDEPSAIKPPTPPPPPSHPEPSNSEKIQSSSENPLSPEEEVNWITISRKQSKHKPTSVPSLLSIPVVPPPNPNSKQKRPQTTSKTKPAIAQPKVIPETVTNSNKQQHPTTVSSTRMTNTVKITQQKSEMPSAWTTYEQTQNTPVAPTTSTLLATAPVFVPSSSLLIPKQIDDLLPVEQPTSSLYWDPNGYPIPPGPVQRPNPTFSPAPGPRCIRRPSPEPFPTYSPLNYTMGNTTSERNSNNNSQWKYPYEEQLPTSTIPNDFPLYDPFNSGAGLTISPSSLLSNDFQGIY